MDKELLESTLERLEHRRQAVTYGALAGVVGGEARTVMAGQPRNPRNSWVVNQATRQPTGYETAQIHPHLAEFVEINGVIETAEALLAWLSQGSERQAQDDWERRILGIGTKSGVTLSNSALSSEELYD